MGNKIDDLVNALNDAIDTSRKDNSTTYTEVLECLEIVKTDLIREMVSL